MATRQQFSCAARGSFFQASIVFLTMVDWVFSRLRPEGVILRSRFSVYKLIVALFLFLYSNLKSLFPKTIFSIVTSRDLKPARPATPWPRIGKSISCAGLGKQNRQVPK